MRILCIGDSNTYGYDPRSYFGDRYPEDIRWTGLLSRAGYEIINCGQNGREIPTREVQFASFAQMIRETQPLDLVTAMLGTNDLLQHSRFTAEDVTERMDRFLSHLILSLPDARFLLIAPPPMQPGEWVNEKRLVTESARLGHCYAELAARLGIGFTDAGEWGVELCFDGVHFSPAGHGMFSARIQKILHQTNDS